MALLTRLSIGFITLVTVLPLSTVGTWWVRLCDFPRLQIAAALFVPLAGLMGWGFRSGWTVEHALLLALCVVLAGWQLSHAVRYSPLVAKELEDIASRTNATTLSVVNLKYENSRKEEVLEQLQREDSDLLLLIEFDKAWASGLAPLEENYAFTAGVVKEEGLGLMLWSKYPLQAPQVRYLVSEKRPSIFAQLELPNRRHVHFVGLHPTPPGLWQKDEQERHDSRIRDAELLVVADLVADAPTLDWIIAGDFNDVAWSHTTRMFKRISGLKDPRVGRGLYNTYHAKYPFWRFPVDQVFMSPSARIVQLQRFQPAGSDHFAITTNFVLNGQESAAPNPRVDDLEEAEDMVEEGVEDAQS